MLCQLRWRRLIRVCEQPDSRPSYLCLTLLPCVPILPLQHSIDLYFCGDYMRFARRAPERHAEFEGFNSGDFVGVSQRDEQQSKIDETLEALHHLRNSVIPSLPDPHTPKYCEFAEDAYTTVDNVQQFDSTKDQIAAVSLLHPRTARVV